MSIPVDYRPNRESLTAAEIQATGLLGGGAVLNIARELIYLRNYIAPLTEQLDAANALMELACADIIFFHSQEYGPSETHNPQVNVAFSVMVNDVFYPAADAEGFELSDAIPLRDVYRKDGYEGVVRWVQKRRNNQPLRPHVEQCVKAQEDLRTENDRLRVELDKATGPVTDEEWTQWMNAEPSPSEQEPSYERLCANFVIAARKEHGNG